MPISKPAYFKGKLLLTELYKVGLKTYNTIVQGQLPLYNVILILTYMLSFSQKNKE